MGRVSNSSSLSGYVPLVTMNVVIFLLWHSFRNSDRYGYVIGSPARDMATWLGFLASSNILGSQRGSPLNPQMSFLWCSISASSISFGSAQSFTSKSFSWILQQNEHMWLHSFIAGVICRQR